MNWRVEECRHRRGLYRVVDESNREMSSIASLEEACLIATAPEMLEALEAQEHTSDLEFAMRNRRFISRPEFQKEYDTWKAAQCRADELLKSALRKARGEPPPEKETRQQSGHPGE